MDDVERDMLTTARGRGQRLLMLLAAAVAFVLMSLPAAAVASSNFHVLP